MTIQVLSGLVLVGAVAVFLYPYLMYMATLRLFSTVPHSPGIGAAVDGGEFSLLFCAYNEVQTMPEKLRNLEELKQRYPAIELLAFDDGSTDGTRAQIEGHPDLVRLVCGQGRVGKAHGMKLLARQAKGSFLVFTDANVLVDLNCVDVLASHYSDPSVGGVCGTLHYSASEESSATEAAGGLYWSLEERIKSAESRTGNVMGADGSIFSVRRDLYPDFPDSVQDDFVVSMNVIFRGSRLIKAPEVKAFERLVAAPRDELHRKVRISARALHTHAYLKPSLRGMAPLDRYKYFAHKILRWWGAVPAVVALLAASVLLGSLGWAGLGVLTLMLVVLLAIWILRPAVIRLVWSLATAVAATFVGAWKARRGQTFATWTPPSTR